MEKRDDPKTADARGRVMCIGRSDCLGVAGVQGDAKTVTVLGGYATSVLTSVTAGSRSRDFNMVELAPTIIVNQIESIHRLIGVDAIKIGLLQSQEQVDIVVNCLERDGIVAPWVVSPALNSAQGEHLVSIRAISALKRRLLTDRAYLCASVSEAETLTGMTIENRDDMMHAAEMMQTFGCRGAFVHSGQFGGDHGIDILVEGDSAEPMDGVPAGVDNFGVNAAMGAAIACALARGRSFRDSVDRARRFVAAGMERSMQFNGLTDVVDHAHASRATEGME